MRALGEKREDRREGVVAWLGVGESDGIAGVGLGSGEDSDIVVADPPSDVQSVGDKGLVQWYMGALGL